MPIYDPQLKLKKLDAKAARAFQRVYPLSVIGRPHKNDLHFATKEIANPRKITVPTRYLDVSALLYSPHKEDLDCTTSRGEKPPLHIILHCGGFIARDPYQEDNVARYLASEVGCYVLVPDYDTAPDVIFPVAEEECYDIWRWAHLNPENYPWDTQKMTLGGSSAGAKLALSTTTQAIDHKFFLPLALSLEFGVCDLSLPVEKRKTVKKTPLIPPILMELIYRSYFCCINTTNPLASPTYHPHLEKLPPTLILTGSHDTLCAEMRNLAQDLKKKGVAVTYHEFPNTDHNFTHRRPIATAKKAIYMIGEHLEKAYSPPASQPF